MLVDSVSALLCLLDNLKNLPTSPPSLYIDLEGVKLGCRGSISILSLYLATTKKVYLVDIHILCSTAFSTTNGAGDSLKAILEASTVPKVFFDIRNDSDALIRHYQISVDGIKDLQLMELST
jgi:exonuclease 3'-5' domain-containing protein 1